MHTHSVTAMTTITIPPPERKSHPQDVRVTGKVHTHNTKIIVLETTTITEAQTLSQGWV